MRRWNALAATRSLPWSSSFFPRSRTRGIEGTGCLQPAAAPRTLTAPGGVLHSASGWAVVCSVMTLHTRKTAAAMPPSDHVAGSPRGRRLLRAAQATATRRSGAGSATPPAGTARATARGRVRQARRLPAGLGTSAAARRGRRAQPPMLPRVTTTASRPLSRPLSHRRNTRPDLGRPSAARRTSSARDNVTAPLLASGRTRLSPPGTQCPACRSAAPCAVRPSPQSAEAAVRRSEPGQRTSASPGQPFGAALHPDCCFTETPGRPLVTSAAAHVPRRYWPSRGLLQRPTRRRSHVQRASAALLLRSGTLSLLH